MVTPNNDTLAIKRVLDAYHAAMVGARVGELEQMLAADFTLTHLTGYVQPKSEWFGVVRSHQFDYHSITLDEKMLDVTPKGDTAVVTGRGIFDATITGMHAPWRLQFHLQFARRGGEWIIARARYSSY